MVSFILAGVVIVVTLVVAAAVAFADGMSDAPAESGIRVWPVFAIGFTIAALLVGSHYVHLTW